MYTVQVLWSMAREKTDIVIVVLKNDAYAILGLEMARVRENELNIRMKSMFDLSNPTLDWVKISTGLGVPAVRAGTAEEFHRLFETALVAEGASTDRVPGRHSERVVRARRLHSPQSLKLAQWECFALVGNDCSSHFNLRGPRSAMAASRRLEPAGTRKMQPFSDVVALSGQSEPVWLRFAASAVGTSGRI